MCKYSLVFTVTKPGVVEIDWWRVTIETIAMSERRQGNDWSIMFSISFYKCSI